METLSTIFADSMRILPEPIMFLLKPLRSVSRLSWSDEFLHSYPRPVGCPFTAHGARIDTPALLQPTNDPSSFFSSEPWIHWIILVIDPKTMPVVWYRPLSISP